VLGETRWGALAGRKLEVSSMHDARDAEHTRLLAAREFNMFWRATRVMDTAS
jgi:hypothetical protein